MGTSLIDAHAGGVGVMESVPVSGAETEGRYEILSTVYFYYYVPRIFLYFILSADYCCISIIRCGSYMPSDGVSLWNFNMPYGCVPEQVVHPRGLGTLLVRYILVDN